ncbi:uroporphyrin-III C-methyltransferase [Primorskyibacter flagellatus]|uniref:uroporphyrinogen-III C-methyltransferase n=1 Tax=Primorskyibacter flagellatus TaxID=1387277 RepID=A0A1W2DGX9_9RHOB|nr:uroporphyrin-III C-methyltransferase [Primorskyibacter flagellatus]
MMHLSTIPNRASLPLMQRALSRLATALRKVADTLAAESAQSARIESKDRLGTSQAEGSVTDLTAILDTRLGHVAFVGAGPGDPDLLTLKARRALDEAEVVIHDRLISPAILALVNPSARLVDAGKEGFGPSMTQEDINALIVAHSRTGARVVRLKSGDATVFGRLDEEIDACDAADVSWHIVPGITAASAAVASIGQSLTKRGRNSSVRFLTGHDTKGFADHDWRALAQPGEVAAIYMGKKSARFIQGRLIMHGADPATPVTVVENASRHDQRVLSSTLATLPADLAGGGMTGPALTFYGLAPRAAAEAQNDIPQQELA